MSKRVATAVAAGVAAFAVAVTAGAALAAPGAHAKKLQVVPIAMHDPGCHWFAVGGKFERKLVVSGPTSFLNQDEAALVFKSRGGTENLAVGKSLTVSKPGVYHITMVGQAPDDNHLLLVVK